MSLQFTCPGCQKLLKVADENLGRKIRCPQCSEVFTIDQSLVDPSTAPQQPDPFPNIQTGPTQQSAMGASSPGQSDNPFASPTASSAMPSAAGHGFTGGQEMRPGKIDFGQVISTAWDTTANNFGTIALFGLLAIVLAIALGIPFQIISAVGEASKDRGMIIATSFIEQIGQQFVNSLIACIGVGISLKILRGSTQPFNNMFDTLKYFGPVLGFQFLFLLIIAAMIIPVVIIFVGLGIGFGRNIGPGVILLMIPVLIGIGIIAIYLGCRWALVNFLIIDRQMPVLESMKVSGQYMEGNKLTYFCIVFVVGLLAIPVVVLTCCLGAIPYAGFYWVLQGVIYLSATSQIARSMPTSDTTGPSPDFSNLQ